MDVIGVHVNRDLVKGGDIVDNIHAAQKIAKSYEIDLGVVQIFVSQTRAKRIIVKPEEEIRLKSLGIPVIAHSTYVSSMFSNDTNMDFVFSELQCCQRAGILGLVIHLPKDNDNVVAKLTTMVGRMAAASMTVKLFLETPAHVASKYRTAAQLAPLIVDNTYIGICIDTAHLWVAGIDVASAASFAVWLADLERLVMPKAEVMWHLNDSKNMLGHGPDKHDSLGEGRIWSDNITTLKTILNFAITHGQYCICERDSDEKWKYDFIMIKRVLNDLSHETH